MLIRDLVDQLFSRGPRDLQTLERLVRDKSVALVGNAASLYERPRDVDRHDVVVRINRGPFVSDPQGIAGRRTDILLISAFRGEEYLSAAPHVVWMTPKKRNSLSRQELRRLYFYPPEWWERLSAEIGARPSTGCMGIDLLSRMIGTGEIHLYGFDFWRTPTSYTGKVWLGPHSPSAEETFARERVQPENIAS